MTMQLSQDASRWMTRSLIAAGALCLGVLLQAQAASAAPITIVPPTVLPLKVVANGSSQLQLNLKAPVGGTFDISVTCGKAYSVSNTNQQITSISTGDENINFLVTADPLTYTDPATGLAIPTPGACELQENVRVNVLNPATLDEGTYNIKPLYPTGAIPLHVEGRDVPQTPPAPNLPLLAVIDGDGTSSANIVSGDPNGVEELKLNDVFVATTVPDGTVFHVLLLPDGTGTLGEIQTTFGTTASTFLSKNGRVSFSIRAPFIEDRVDVTNTVHIWTENGNARSAVTYEVLYLAPGYMGKTLLELPFEDSYGVFTLQSRGAAPLAATSARLIGNPSNDPSRSTNAKKDFALSRHASEVLVYGNTGPLHALEPSEGSMTAWLSPRDVAHGDIIILADTDDTGGGTSGIQLGLSATNEVSFRYGSTAPIISAPFTWAAGTYHHVAATWKSGEIALYVDGRIVGSPVTAGITPPASLESSVSVGFGLEGELDQVVIYAAALNAGDVKTIANETPFGAINTVMQMFSVTGFESTEILGESLDILEPVHDQCFDAGESVGALSQLCHRSLNTQPRAPVRVVECVDRVSREIVPCDPSGDQDNQADTLYTAAVGAQQFGGAALTTIGLSANTDVAKIPYPGFSLAAATDGMRFASPISTRFRLPPQSIPNLVICSYPAVAGQEYNLAEAREYIFEDRGDPALHYPPDGSPLSGRFRCPATLAELEEYRTLYSFKLRDNTNQVLDRNWAFRFGTSQSATVNDGEAYAFEVQTYDPLNDAAQLLVTPAVPYVSTYVSKIIDNQRTPRTGLSISSSPIFHLTAGTGQLDISLPGDYTRLAAMTVTNPGALTQPTTAGYVVMRNVHLMFAGPLSNPADVASYFDVRPFDITYEVQPAAPSILGDEAMYPEPGSYCVDHADDPTCGAAIQLQLSKLHATFTNPSKDGPQTLANLRLQLLYDEVQQTYRIRGTSNGNSIKIALEKLTSTAENNVKTQWLDWSTSTFSPVAKSVEILNSSTAATPETFVWSHPFNVNLENGMYRLSVTTYDRSGVAQPPPATFTFRITAG